MAQWVKINSNTGAVDQNDVRSAAPDVLEKPPIRWVEVTAAALQVWQRYGGLPASVATDATSCARIVITTSLADWKVRRKADIRAEQWRRIGLVYPIGQVIYYYAVAIRLAFKKANGNNLTAGETTTMQNIGAALANTVEPISEAADAAVTAINAAANHAAVETAYVGVTWP